MNAPHLQGPETHLWNGVIFNVISYMCVFLLRSNKRSAVKRRSIELKGPYLYDKETKNNSRLTPFSCQQWEVYLCNVESIKLRKDRAAITKEFGNSNDLGRHLHLFQHSHHHWRSFRLCGFIKCHMKCEHYSVSLSTAVTWQV